MKTSAEIFPRIHSSNSRFNDWMNRSFADVQMMTIGNREQNFPYAGVPWFSTVFGRDGIITAMETLWIAPRSGKGFFNSWRKLKPQKLTNRAKPSREKFCTSFGTAKWRIWGKSHLPGITAVSMPLPCS